MIKYYLVHGIDPSRKPFMENQFKLFGIPAEDVSWILYPNKTDPLPDGICIKPDLPKGHIACTYKHYLILKDIVEKQYPLAVLMEDNIEFRGNVPEILSRYLKDLPADWDCVFDSDYCGFCHDGLITPEMSVYKRDNTKGSSKGAHFILLNLSAATKLYNNFLPFHEGTDHMYNYLFQKLNMNVYWAEPPNVHKIQRESTWMDTPVSKKRFIWLNR
jgi:GR25 family glycosyltransferase involved in LPS biosynthesis